MKIKSIYKYKEFNEKIKDKKNLIQWLVDEQDKRFYFLKYCYHSKTCDRLVNQINEISELIYMYHPIRDPETEIPSQWEYYYYNVSS